MEEKEKIKNLLDDILKFFDIRKFEIVEEKTQEGVVFNIKGERDKMGILIGRSGNTLHALEVLINAIIYKNKEVIERIVLDVQGYKRQHKENLINLANRIAKKVHQLKKRIALRPMNPADRRIIHIALRDNRYVTTESEGVGNNRRVVVIPKR